MKRKVAYTLVVCLLITVIPLLIISHYNVPLGDDFAHAIRTIHAWRETHSVWEVFKAACGHVLNQYMTIQGRYVETLFVSMAPIMFQSYLNFVGGYISIFLFVGSQLFLSYVLFGKIIKADRYDWMLIGIPIIIMQLLFMCSPSEGLYWNAGAVAYTWGYSFGILSIAAFLYLTMGGACRQRFKKVLLYILLIGSTVWFTGSNFVIGLSFLVVAFLLVLICFRYCRQYIKIAGVWFGIGVVNFLIVILAPGNRLRMSYVTGYSPVKSIITSYLYAFKFVWQFLNTPMILMFLFMIPILWKVVRKIKFSFRYPLPAVFIAFSAFTSSMVPAFYGMGDLAPGPWRTQNVWKHMLFWLILFVLIYLIGWLQNQMKVQITVKEMKNSYKAAWILGAFFCMGWCLYVMGPFESLTSIRAMKSLKSGQAAQYHSEWMERVEILENSEISNAVLKPFTDPPYVLFYYDGEIQEDAADERNQYLMQFYDKESVELSTGE